MYHMLRCTNMYYHIIALTFVKFTPLHALYIFSDCNALNIQFWTCNRSVNKHDTDINSALIKSFQSGSEISFIHNTAASALLESREKTLPHHIIAFDEGERILIVSFLGKSLSRVLWTSSSGAGRHFGPAGWLTGYVAQIASISVANVFLAALS